MSDSTAVAVPGAATIAVRMFGGLRHSAYPAYRIFLRDIRARYANSVLGIFWEFAEPIVMALPFIFLHRARAIDMSDLQMPYSVFVVCGILLWQSFAEGLTTALSSVRTMASLFGNITVRPEVLILSVVFRVAFNSFLRWLVIVAVVMWFGFRSPLHHVLFILSFPAVILFGLGLGFLLAPFSVVFGDIARAVPIFLRPLMFVSSTVFVLPKTGALGILAVINPVAVLIDNQRSLLISGALVAPTMFWGVLSATVVLFLLAWYVYHVCLPLVSTQG
jgi:lipopolysaccharide transport system permease protein